MFGEKIAHGTTFRRAVEEGCWILNASSRLASARRATPPVTSSGASIAAFVWSGRAVLAQIFDPLMAEVRQQMGAGPVYLSFDIDSLDPIWAPGTGTPEVGGLTSIQALEIVRGCRGLNLIGCDLVEVSPPYDVSGNTSQLAANLLYEMLCVLPA
jgi:guanidinobutyrase